MEKIQLLASLNETRKFELRGAELSRIYLKVGKVLQEEKALLVGGLVENLEKLQFWILLNILGKRPQLLLEKWMMKWNLLLEKMKLDCWFLDPLETFLASRVDLNSIEEVG